MKDMGTTIARFREWGICSGVPCLRGAPCWPSTVRSAVKSVILNAHASTAEDRSNIQNNTRWPARPMTLGGFTTWLNSRAGPLTHRVLTGDAGGKVEKPQGASACAADPAITKGSREQPEQNSPHTGVRHPIAGTSDGGNEAGQCQTTACNDQTAAPHGRGK